MKKLLLGIGAIASVVAPIATVVSCGSDSKDIRTYTEDFSSDKTAKEVEVRYWKLINHRAYDTVGADEAHFIFVNGDDKFDMKMATGMSDAQLDEQQQKLNEFMDKVYDGVTGERPATLGRIS